MRLMPDYGREQLEHQVAYLIRESNKRVIHTLYNAFEIERTALRKRDLGEEMEVPDITETFSSAEDMGLARGIAIIKAAKASLET